MSSGVVADIIIMSDIVCATFEPVGAVTNAPPRAPTLTSIRPIASSERSASRTVTRLTPNCSASSRSGDSRSPALIRPVRIAVRICSAIAEDARATATGAKIDSATPSTLGRRAAGMG